MHPVPARRAMAAAPVALPTLAACGGRDTRDPRLPPSLVLDVQKHGDFDVAVFAAHAGAGTGARRADVQTGPAVAAARWLVAERAP